ncbi:CocE/NonD family hydrolase [Nonomuraea rhodomycinica]|uniref:CocE/NonD family hydrolase n=1 Tax=Nonomuraea rhodomycinica TaxID=1712872 RepID=A0A7Y6MCJ3_9ACTN|nr:CocE/NonD family hydrolase [Nonomuraea rhodomycinica]NUW41584.1 CocE/NonD family hydrolase [Nonomuraea rhodomycinica]
MLQRAKDRTFWQRLADQQWTKYARLPAPTSDYTVTRDARIPMRDRVDLLADLYEPKGPVSGTILVTSPYGYNVIGAAMTGGVFACRGYRVVLVRCRGTFGSGGTFEPHMRDVDDAADIVAWMREQPWFDGRFAAHGYSSVGFAVWASLMDPPPELVTAVIACAPYDFGAFVYTGGAFQLSTMFEWSFVTSRQEEPLLPRILGVLSSRGRVREALAALPLTDAADKLMDGKAPWYREWVSRRDLGDPWWQRADLTDALERVHVPVLLQGGWQDGFLRQTLAGYARLAGRGVDVGLTMGPWTHAQGGAAGARVLLPEALAWFDEHLAGSGDRRRAMPVKVFVSGPGEGWRDLPAWPPATVDQVFHPRSGKTLAAQPAQPGEVGEFTYDPANPTPTYGGAFVTQLSPGVSAGYTDDSALASRPDVLTFTSDPLTAQLAVIGSPVVEVGHGSDNPFADLFLRLSEVDADGRSRNVSDGYVRLDPSRPTGVVRLELDPVAHCFAPGNRLRLIIAGGSHPRWERNLGTGDDPATSTRMQPSHRTIDLSTTRVLVPVAHPGHDAG